MTKPNKMRKIGKYFFVKTFRIVLSQITSCCQQNIALKKFGKQNKKYFRVLKHWSTTRLNKRKKINNYRKYLFFIFYF